jgi:integrase/recombinase XerD
MNNLISIENRSLSTKGLNETYQVKIKKFNKFMDSNPGASIIDFFNQAKQEYKAATVHSYKAAIKAAMRQELRRHKHDTLDNISALDIAFKNIKEGKPDKKISKDQILTIEEINELVSVSGQKTGLLIQALYQTAARVSELINIKLSDCEERDNGIIIRIMGKGNKERFVYMTTQLYLEIKRVYQGQAFMFEYRKQPISRQAVHKAIKNAGEKIGRSDIHPHTLRHSFATNRLEKDLNLAAISDYLGHNDISITTKYYLHNKADMNKILQGVN